MTEEGQPYRVSRICEQCFEEYQAGTGATEPGPSRVRLPERFCSETCAAEHEREMSNPDPEEE